MWKKSWPRRIMRSHDSHEDREVLGMPGEGEGAAGVQPGTETPGSAEQRPAGNTPGNDGADEAMARRTDTLPEPREDEKPYNCPVRCLNCDWHGWVKIPVGRKFEPATLDTEHSYNDDASCYKTGEKGIGKTIFGMEAEYDITVKLNCESCNLPYLVRRRSGTL
jgi:hypothetical protein